MERRDFLASCGMGAAAALTALFPAKLLGAEPEPVDMSEYPSRLPPTIKFLPGEDEQIAYTSCMTNGELLKQICKLSDGVFDVDDGVEAVTLIRRIVRDYPRETTAIRSYWKMDAAPGWLGRHLARYAPQRIISESYRRLARI